MRAVYPGSFNPPTIGHIAIANSAIQRFDISELHLVISTVALGKEKLTVP
ncbi:MAG: adenylyltransferase/cytidyltransferase family protein, partial [Actinomycetota bacterium]|nr:adenylyltransferase/cytidyltransferase family protein [Actinomycetota bacterium]